MNLTSLHKQAPLLISVSMDIPVSPANCCKTFLSRHMLQTRKSPRKRAYALALVSQRATYHGYVPRDESGAFSKAISLSFYLSNIG
jgi:hypothetical protein